MSSREEIRASSVARLRRTTHCRRCEAVIDANIYLEPLCKRCRKELREQRLHLLNRRETDELLREKERGVTTYLVRLIMATVVAMLFLSLLWRMLEALRALGP